jgi:hypothetical protein
MAKDDLVSWLGRPNSTMDLTSAKIFVYQRIAKDPDSGKTVDAMVTVENGRVTKVNF